MASASRVPFHALCNALERIQKKKGHTEKLSTLQSFIHEWRSKSFNLSDPDDSFYPMLRCITPHLEKIAYGIKEHSLGRLYVDIIGLGKKSDAANKLMNYKRPTALSASAKAVGDFAECAFEVLKDRCSVRPSLSVKDVVDELDAIAAGYSNNDRAAVRQAMERITRALTGFENKWFIRVLVKDMKLGLGQDSILSSVHPDAPALFTVDTSLERICKTLRDNSKRLHEIEVSLFAPLKPMLGKQTKPTDVEDQLQNGFLIERKFDGERMQLHKKDDEYRYFSRNGHDYTKTYGATEFAGNLTPRLHTRLKGVTNCILDGEMCGWDEELQVLGTKAMNFDIKSGSVQRYSPCYIVFDLLYLNGEVMTNKPLRERLEKLQTIIDDQEGLIAASSHTFAKYNKDCVDALNQAIDRYEEGIMVKDPESVYKPNSRTAGWYKIKPEYVDGLMDELDVIILGGYFGKGRRSKILSHFLCGVMSAGDKPTYHSMARVGSGYTFKELLDFNVKLKSHWTNKQPDNVLVTSERPDVWIDPANSAILQVKATEITESRSFSTGFTLRFPRVDKIRDDKSPADCLTLQEFHQMRTKNQGQLASKLENTVSSEPEKKKRRQATPAMQPKVAERFRATDTSAIIQEYDTFDGKELCVVNGSTDWPKQRLEKEIVRLGGSVVQNAGTGTFCIIADKRNVKVNNYASSGKYNVAKVDWLARCITLKALIPWGPADMLASSVTLQSEFTERFDKFNDSFFLPTTVEALKASMEKCPVPEAEASVCKVNVIRDLEADLYTGDDYPNCLFRHCGMLDGDRLCNEPTTAAGLAVAEFRFYGGVVVADLGNSLLTHCVCTHRRSEKMLVGENENRERKLHIVSPSWVASCVSSGKLLHERDYSPRHHSP